MRCDAMRWEWPQHNPIAKVRQSSKRLRTPDVLTPAEITALLAQLQEPLRTATEIDAFNGLRRGELIGRQWQDVNFDAQVIHVRRSVVMMVQGLPKTDASAKRCFVGFRSCRFSAEMETVQSVQPPMHRPRS